MKSLHQSASSKRVGRSCCCLASYLKVRAIIEHIYYQGDFERRIRSLMTECHARALPQKNNLKNGFALCGYRKGWKVLKGYLFLFWHAAADTVSFCCYRLDLALLLVCSNLMHLSCVDHHQVIYTTDGIVPFILNLFKTEQPHLITICLICLMNLSSDFNHRKTMITSFIGETA